MLTFLVGSLGGLESGGEDGELEVELPPPMRVLEEPLSMPAAASIADSSISGQQQQCSTVQQLVAPSAQHGVAALAAAAHRVSYFAQ